MARTKEQILAYKREWARKWRAANPDKVSAQNKKHAAKYPEKMHARSAKYYAENKDKRKEAWAKWYAENRDAQIKRAVRYAKENKARVYAVKNARMKKIGADGLTGYQRDYRDNREAKLAAAKREYLKGGKERTLAWAKANPEKVKAIAKKTRAKYADKISAENKRRYLKRGAEYYRKLSAKYREQHGGRIRAYDAARRAAKLKATPEWRNEFFIEEIYDLAKRRKKLLGINFTVDHIVPLKSKLVCGLHNEFNLQIVSHSKNSSKGNRVWPNMPEKELQQ